MVEELLSAKEITKSSPIFEPKFDIKYNETKVDILNHKTKCPICKKVDISLERHHTHIEIYNENIGITIKTCCCVPCAVKYLPDYTKSGNRNKRNILEALPKGIEIIS